MGVNFFCLFVYEDAIEVNIIELLLPLKSTSRATSSHKLSFRNEPKDMYLSCYLVTLSCGNTGSLNTV